MEQGNAKFIMVVALTILWLTGVLEWLQDSAQFFLVTPRELTMVAIVALVAFVVGAARFIASSRTKA